MQAYYGESLSSHLNEMLKPLTNLDRPKLSANLKSISAPINMKNSSRDLCHLRKTRSHNKTSLRSLR
jgi:hypothetical protein